MKGYTIPRTATGLSSLVPAPPWHYVGDFLVVDYWADPEAVLDALKRVKVCDPACGSGAYLLGMMQEVLRLRPGFPIVLCTGFSQTLSEDQAHKLGISEFLLKPVTRDNLSAAIQRALARPSDTAPG